MYKNQGTGDTLVASKKLGEQSSRRIFNRRQERRKARQCRQCNAKRNWHSRRQCRLSLLLLSFLLLPLSAHVTATLITSSTHFQSNKKIEAAIVFSIEKDWHMYWSNPGDSGMAPSVKWNLPKGWTASDLAFPLPHRESSNNLTSFVYSEKVILPFTFTAATDAENSADITGKISWLVCDSKLCVSGSQDVSLSLKRGDDEKKSPQKEIITQAQKLIPIKNENYSLSIKEEKDFFTLNISAPEKIDLSNAEIFPLTEQIFSHAEKIVVTKIGNTYSAKIKPSEYFSPPLTKCSIILSHPKLAQSLLLEWKKQ